MQMPLMERIYRYFWRRKGDVYALLWDMQRSVGSHVPALSATLHGNWIASFIPVLVIIKSALLCCGVS